jgi:hypothetical protein
MPIKNNWIIKFCFCQCICMRVHVTCVFWGVCARPQFGQPIARWLSSLFSSLSIHPFFSLARGWQCGLEFLSTRARGRKATLGSSLSLLFWLAAVAGASAKNKSLLAAGGRCLHSPLSLFLSLRSSLLWVSLCRALPLINRTCWFFICHDFVCTKYFSELILELVLFQGLIPPLCVAEWRQRAPIMNGIRNFCARGVSLFSCFFTFICSGLQDSP